MILTPSLDRLIARLHTMDGEADLETVLAEHKTRIVGS